MWPFVSSPFFFLQSLTTVDLFYRSLPEWSVDRFILYRACQSWFLSPCSMHWDPSLLLNVRSLRFSLLSDTLPLRRSLVDRRAVIFGWENHGKHLCVTCMWYVLISFRKYQGMGWLGPGFHVFLTSPEPDKRPCSAFQLGVCENSICPTYSDSLQPDFEKCF